MISFRAYYVFEQPSEVFVATPEARKSPSCLLNITLFRCRVSLDCDISAGVRVGLEIGTGCSSSLVDCTGHLATAVRNVSSVEQIMI